LNLPQHPAHINGAAENQRPFQITIEQTKANAEDGKKNDAPNFGSKSSVQNQAVLVYKMCAGKRLSFL
jgi:hypothetical protein